MTPAQGKKIIEVRRRACDPSVTRNLKNVQAEIAKGEIVSFAFCGVRRNGNVVTFYSHEANPSLLGASAILNERLVREF